MTEQPEPTAELSPEELAGLEKVLEMNAERAGQRLTDLAANWGLGGLQTELAELLGGLPEGDRPAVAVDLVTALKHYLEKYGPTGVVGTADTYRDHA